MTDPAILVEGASKRYIKYDDTPMLVTRLSRLRSHTTRNPLWAVRGASFEVAPGEVLGIIGRNGSGKSTLLRMLAGVTAPTEGRVAVRGRIAPLISVGVGFHPELTGRENVYINATVLGLTRKQIDERFDELVEFSEIAPFIDTPVKFYSSGMYVRLGFAVSVVADPDVLIVDEVLSVGDIAFQLKCVDRMAEIQKSGATIVVVSHNMAAIRNLCPRTIVMHNGTVRHDGDTERAISLYHQLLSEDRDLEDQMGRPAQLAADREFDKRAQIETFDLHDSLGESTRHVDSGQEAVFTVQVRFLEPTDRPLLGFTVTSGAGVHVYSETTGWSSETSYRAGDLLQATIRVRMRLASGTYSCAAGLATRDGVPIASQVPPILVYVGGRNVVSGLADLAADFEIEQPFDVSGAEPRWADGA